jgi:hypothetical protein
MHTLQRRIFFCQQSAWPINTAAIFGAARRVLLSCLPSPTVPRFSGRGTAMAQRFFCGNGFTPFTGLIVATGAGISPHGFSADSAESLLLFAAPLFAESLIAAPRCCAG